MVIDNPDNAAASLPLCVFAYNFPHRKTQDILVRLFLEQIPVRLVLAADPVRLSISPASVRTKIRHEQSLHPRDVALRIGARYETVKHNSPETIALLREESIEVAVVAGARILSKEVISAVPRGIVNLHPGLIPEARGLDTLLWSIRSDIPLGVTAHLIDEKVDLGRILERRPIAIHHDDTLFDLSERLYETQLDVLPGAIKRAYKGDWAPVSTGSKYNRKMPADLEAETMTLVEAYISRHASMGSGHEDPGA